MKPKHCWKCKTTENINKNGNSYICLSCNRLKSKKYYDKQRKLVFEHYGGVCACCSESNDLFLSIDHINNDGHTETWPSGSRIVGRQMYQRIVKSEFPETYQLLCMNCNFGKRMNNGICPHEISGV